jgi:KTSC domain
MDFDRGKCFKRGGYDPVSGKVVVQFSDQSIYEYDGLSLNQWILWRDSYPRGTYFNHYYRYSDTKFKRLDAYPEKLWYEFIES